MKYKEENGVITLFGAKQFSIGEILECGQCFRFEKLGVDYYYLIAHGRVLHVEQNDNTVKFWYENSKLNICEFKTIWEGYFDLSRDYGQIQAKITENDPVMTRAVNFAPGIRILKQDPWETLISFIISQNNRIPQIKQVIKNISEAYGDALGGGHHAFPTIQQLLMATAPDLRNLKAGFRDKYIVDATSAANAASMDDLESNLLDIKGVGEKVANCVLLFGYARHDRFPVDVWVRRVMEKLYFDGEPTPIATIQNFAKERFGEYSGFAQQYLFHYIRMNPDAENL